MNPMTRGIEMSNHSQIDTDLPDDPDKFYRAGRGAEELAAPSVEGLPSALEQLGASPFPKSGFPLLGFLATLYDQVASTSRVTAASDAPPDTR